MGLLAEITEELNNLFTDNPDLVATIPRKYVSGVPTTDAYGRDHYPFLSTTIDTIPLGDESKLLIQSFGKNVKSTLMFFAKTEILKDDIITWESEDYKVIELNRNPIGTTNVGTFFGVVKKIK